MNFFPNIPILPNQQGYMNSMEYMNNIFNKFNEFENRIRTLESRVYKLENNKTEDIKQDKPDDSFYMI